MSIEYSVEQHAEIRHGVCAVDIVNAGAYREFGYVNAEALQRRKQLVGHSAGRIWIGASLTAVASFIG